MENPATWTELEKTINEALIHAAEARSRGVIGASTAKQVADALKAKGLVKTTTE